MTQADVAEKNRYFTIVKPPRSSIVSPFSARLLAVPMRTDFSSQALFSAKIGSHVGTLGAETLLLQYKVRLLSF